jgi:hypothetical protein
MPLPRESIPRIVGGLQRDPSVLAVWIGGSVRDGTDDEVSDLDLWVESEGWTPDRANGLLVAGTHTAIDDVPLLHGVDELGVIVDLRYGSEVPPEYRKLDRFPGVEFSGKEMDPVGFRTDFWINSYKHRKPIWRGLDSLVLFGLPFDRMALVRAWVVDSTGDPNAQLSFSIHGLTDVVLKHMTPERMAILGLPTRDRTELLEAISVYRSEMFRMSPRGLRLPSIVMDDPLFAGLCRDSGVTTIR